MSNDNSALVNYNPGHATLLEMRADSERFPRLKSVPREKAVYEMSKIVSQAFLYKGQAADQSNIQFIATALVGELLDDKRLGLPNLSIAEIQAVVKSSVLGGSEMYGISVSSLYKVIADYAKGEGHNNQIQVDVMRRKEAIDKSPVSPMLRSYAGRIIRNNKIK